MNRRKKHQLGLWTFAVAVIVVGSAWFAAGGRKPDSIQSSIAEVNGRPPSQKEKSVEAEATRSPSKQRPGWAMAFSPEEYLKNASNRSAALVALFAYTNDPDYLDALKKLALADPSAAVFVILQSYREDSRSEQRQKERLDALREAHQRFPDDPLVTACLAGSEAVAGNHENARAALMEMKDFPKLTQDSAERRKAMRELLLLDGVDETETFRRAASYEIENFAAVSGILSALAKTISQVSKMPMDARIEASSGIIALNQALNPTGSAFEFQGYVTLGLEKQMLQSLPPDVEYGDSGQTVADRLQEIATAYQVAEHLRTHVAPFLENGRPGLLDEYFERREKYGMEAALKWAEGVMAAQQ